MNACKAIHYFRQFLRFRAQLTNGLHISMELGCFLAGVVVRVQGNAVGEEVTGLIQPIKDFFACLFFASIGLLIVIFKMLYA